jgi:hypothetical protein
LKSRRRKRREGVKEDEKWKVMKKMEEQEAKEK